MPDEPEFVEALRAWREAMTPGNEHALLEHLAGEWRVAVRFHGGGTPYESAAEATNRLAHGGRFLVGEIAGQIQAPDEQGTMRPEAYSATRILGYDRYKRAWVGAFIENQNSHLLSFTGTAVPGREGRHLVLCGTCDEPMLGLQDTTLRHELVVHGPDAHVWEVYAMAAGGIKVFDFEYTR